MLLVLGMFACSPPPPRQPVGAPPDPDTVTRENPGGNAHDPHQAALERALLGTWGHRRDRDDQVEAPLPDVDRWRRVRYYGFEHFVGFRYGDDHHIMAIAFVQDVPPGAPHDSLHCIRRFEAWARVEARDYAVQLEPIGTHHARWQGRPLVIRSVDGSAAHLLSRKRFSAAWAGYAAYPDACLIYGMAAQWHAAPDLARQVRNRFVEEGFLAMRTLTRDKAWRREP
jgi:hypothetical protein